MKHPPIHDYALAPVIFLLRQYIELQLKGVFFQCGGTSKVEKSHDIIRLYHEAFEAMKKEYGAEAVGNPNPETEKFVYSLGSFDPTGQTFRYPETSKGEGFSKRIERMDAWLYGKITGIQDLSDVVTKIIADLEGLEACLEELEEGRQEEMGYEET